MKYYIILNKKIYLDKILPTNYLIYFIFDLPIFFAYVAELVDALG